MIFFKSKKGGNISKIENKASLHKVEHRLFKQRFSHFPMNINGIANQTYNKKREIQYPLKVENKARGEALAKRLSLGNRDRKSSLCFGFLGFGSYFFFFLLEPSLRKPTISGFYF